MHDDKLKISLARKILSISDSALLEKISALLDQPQESDTVAYSSSGAPLTLEAYNDMLAAAEKDLDEGRTLSTTEVRDNLKKWQESKK